MSYTGDKASFDGVADSYADVRPSYPGEIGDAAIALGSIPQGGRILEIGCGTGQATERFAERGFRIVALEPGENLGAVAARRLKPYAGVSIVRETFESYAAEQTFDAIIAAQAFHWIPLPLGFERAREMLRSGGSIALIWNLTPKREGEGAVWDAVQEAYNVQAPEIANPGGGSTLTGTVHGISAALAQCPLFGRFAERRHAWSRRYTTAEYIALLNTYSNHIGLPEATRKALHGAIARAIDAQGGSVVKSYISVLYSAQAV